MQKRSFQVNKKSWSVIVHFENISLQNVKIQNCRYDFPAPEVADANGLLAVGADLQPDTMLYAYTHGIFPWYSKDPILWFSPPERFVLPVSEVHIGRTIRKEIRKLPFQVKIDRQFERCVEICAQTHRKTWITQDMKSGYHALHQLGFAHSIEIMDGSNMVGGAFGVAVGKMFFGESMFHIRENASKLAFTSLARVLQTLQFELIDSQVETQNLRRFGARNIPREKYLQDLALHVDQPSWVGNWQELEKFLLADDPSK